MLEEQVADCLLVRITETYTVRHFGNTALLISQFSDSLMKEVLYAVDSNLVQQIHRVYQ